MNNYLIKANTSFIGQTGYNAHSRDFFTALSKKNPLTIRNFTVGSSWSGLGSKMSNGKYGDPHTKEKYLNNYQRKLISEQSLHSEPKTEGYYNGLCDYEINDGLDYLNKYKSNDIINIVLNGNDHPYFHCIDKYKGFKIVYNAWESTTYDDVFFELLKKYDQFWCPSEWQRKCIINQGYPEDKVFVVPEAVDGTIFNPDYFNSNLDLYKDNRFKFVMFGKWEYRKSTIEIIETFLNTFKKDEPVDLILSVDDNNNSTDGLKSTEDRLSYFNLNDDRLKVLHFVDRNDYINYLKNGHVFLSCARSEGWNLPLIESMACGTPSIYSNCSGQLEFVEGKGHPVKILGEKKSPYCSGNYYEPDFDDLSKVMRDVYVNYWKYKEKSIKESEIIRNEFTWEKSADKAIKILNNIK